MAKRSQTTFFKKQKADGKKKKQEEKFQKRLERAKVKKETKESGTMPDLIDFDAYNKITGADELTQNENDDLSNDASPNND
ncbi:MAG: hypothetical protein GC181_07925 [Bacteroidetes bacterium]|nr:hypothetical protein [Bacteroidota bacterium]